MTRGPRLPATRSNLMRCRRRLAQVRRGADLLKRKRESLVAELFDRARPAVTARAAIDDRAREAWRALWEALAWHGGDGLAPLGWPTRDVEVDLATIDVWGLKVPTLVHRPAVARTLAGRGVRPGPGEAATQDAARGFEELVEHLIEAAPEEHLMRRLGQALSRTTRLVNTLEQRVAADLDADLAAISRTLDEREREEQRRIKRLITTRRTRGH
ncbi:MAG: V-type ATP synthase subunit D [Acidobacteriota bacterium]|nr:V-type ATP synthase subunit D [Acidobacteriota bacterium]